MTGKIYLDNSATTKVREEVAEAMRPYLTENWGNPSSIHEMGRIAQSAIASARSKLACLLQAKPEEIYFTPCGTYSNNVAIIGRARFAEANNQGRHLITSSIEHSSVIGPVKYLESQGWNVTLLPVDKEGFVKATDFKNAITSQTSIISIMWANNEVGTIEPIRELADIAKAYGIYFHTDAVQAAGKIKVNCEEVAVSTLSISGHKFYAPKGIGALFVRQGVNVMPMVFGGGQEKALFPGTESVANIVALGKAAELALEEMDQYQKNMRFIQEAVINKLLACPGVKLTGAKDLDHRVPGHVSVLVPHTDGEALVMKADLKGIMISSGSACRQGIIEPSRILLALGWPQDEALGSARITAGRYNNLKECQEAASLLHEVFSQLGKSQSACTPA